MAFDWDISDVVKVHLKHAALEWEMAADMDVVGVQVLKCELAVGTGVRSIVLIRYFVPKPR